MNKLNKELESIEIERQITEGDTFTYEATFYLSKKEVSQIKTVILEALKAEMPNKIDNTKDIRAIWDDTDFAVDWRLGYNRAIDDCLEVCNKLLGDSNAE